MFFKEQGNLPKKAPSDFDLACTDKLIQALQSAGKIKRRINRLSWAKQFTTLRTDYPPKKIQKLLKFYCAHIGQPYIPQAYSAAGFSHKIEQIAAARRRHKENPHPPTTSVKITEDAQQVVLLSGDLIWPGKEKKDELTLIQATLDAFNRFLDDFYDFKESCPNDKDVQYFWRAMPGEPESFTLSWLLRIHNMACKWDKWHGKLLTCIWHYEHRWFAKDMEKLVMEWDEQSETWHAVKARFQQFLKKR